jgi:hypothetical protein
MKFTYSGDLAKPLKPPVIGLLMDDDQIAKIGRDRFHEEARRMGLLFDAHNIRHGNWVALCFALAKAHVPGFKMAKGRAGAPKKWQDYDRAMLVLAIEETGLGVTEAARLLVKQEPWKSMTRATRGAKTLSDEYTRADARWVAMARDAKAFDSLPEEEKEAARNLSGGY